MKSKTIRKTQVKVQAKAKRMPRQRALPSVQVSITRKREHGSNFFVVRLRRDGQRTLFQDVLTCDYERAVSFAQVFLAKEGVRMREGLGNGGRREL